MKGRNELIGDEHVFLWALFQIVMSGKVFEITNLIAQVTLVLRMTDRRLLHQQGGLGINVLLHPVNRLRAMKNLTRKICLMMVTRLKSLRKTKRKIRKAPRTKRKKRRKQLRR